MARRRSGRQTRATPPQDQAPQENQSNEVESATTTETPAITPAQPAQQVTQTKERKKMAGLNPTQLQGLLAKSKVKGSGETVLKNFIASGDVSTEVDLASGPLAGKTPEQASTTLRNAQKRVVTDANGQTSLALPDAGTVRIVTAAVDENGEPVKADKAHPATTVYLINTAALADEGDEG